MTAETPGGISVDDSSGTGTNNSISGSAGSKCTINIDADAIINPVSSTTFTNVTVTGVTLSAPTGDGNVDGGGNTGIDFS